LATEASCCALGCRAGQHGSPPSPPMAALDARADACAAALAGSRPQAGVGTAQRGRRHLGGRKDARARAPALARGRRGGRGAGCQGALQGREPRGGRDGLPIDARACRAGPAQRRSAGARRAAALWRWQLKSSQGGGPVRARPHPGCTRAWPAGAGRCAQRARRRPRRRRALRPCAPPGRRPPPPLPLRPPPLPAPGARAPQRGRPAARAAARAAASAPTATPRQPARARRTWAPAGAPAALCQACLCLAQRGERRPAGGGARERKRELRPGPARTSSSGAADAASSARPCTSSASCSVCGSRARTSRACAGGGRARRRAARPARRRARAPWRAGAPRAAPSTYSCREVLPYPAHLQRLPIRAPRPA
jgi:hypothetical protein